MPIIELGKEAKNCAHLVGLRDDACLRLRSRYDSFATEKKLAEKEREQEREREIIAIWFRCRRRRRRRQLHSLYCCHCRLWYLHSDAAA